MTRDFGLPTHRWARAELSLAYSRIERSASSMKHRSDIDGLRAVAVLAVVFFHAGLPGTSGGFVGVDIFFVISGYLISSIIATELRDHTFSLVKFYERRCRRILPALFVMFAVVFVLASAVLLPPDMVAFCRSLLSATLFVSNIYFWKTSTYFEGASQFKPLLHTWSLGVEEQFYIIMPLVLMLVARQGQRRVCTVAAAAVRRLAATQRLGRHACADCHFLRAAHALLGVDRGRPRQPRNEQTDASAPAA